ncbi:hypothetical protein J2W51_002319 [Tardiphaga robiniae]|uniref:hypothetical protein n=1 Tax=Tardiphaga robiniae TaxID=943830 RepID=UPI002857632C|nr:hypothetical protein [Tardiphaga robiniae]MDR6659749.1 hypothetical protein [Tardiphaga robiniae]
MPFSAILGRIRKLLLVDEAEHYAAIERGFQDGSLKQPVTPMSDAELAEAMAEFTKTQPSPGSIKTLGQHFNPKK